MTKNTHSCVLSPPQNKATACPLIPQRAYCQRNPQNSARGGKKTNLSNKIQNPNLANCQWLTNCETGRCRVDELKKNVIVFYCFSKNERWKWPIAAYFPFSFWVWRFFVKMELLKTTPSLRVSNLFCRTKQILSCLLSLIMYKTKGYAFSINQLRCPRYHAGQINNYKYSIVKLL